MSGAKGLILAATLAGGIAAILQIYDWSREEWPRTRPEQEKSGASREEGSETGEIEGADDGSGDATARRSRGQREPSRWPASGTITREYLRGRHTGVHIEPADSKAVYATGSGVIDSITYRDRARGRTPGWEIAISHGRGIRTIYQGLTQPSIVEGIAIGHGNLIGYIASRPNADNELHYGIEVNGRAINPIVVLRDGPDNIATLQEGEGPIGRRLTAGENMRRQDGIGQIPQATMTCEANHDGSGRLAYNCLIRNSPAVRRHCEVVLTCKDATDAVLGSEGISVVLEEDRNGRITGNIQCRPGTYYAPLQIGHEIACVP